MDIFITQSPDNVGVIAKMKLPGNASLAGIQVFGGEAVAANEINAVSSGLVVITGYQYNQMTNQQIVQSLGEQFFLYSFGDKMGNITINGLAFRGACSSNTSNKEFVNSSTSTGLLQVLEFYAKHKINIINPATGAFPIVRTKIDGQEIDGVLVNCTVNINDASSYLGTFSMNLVTIPSV